LEEREERGEGEVGRHSWQSPYRVVFGEGKKEGEVEEGERRGSFLFPFLFHFFLWQMEVGRKGEGKEPAAAGGRERRKRRERTGSFFLIHSPFPFITTSEWEGSHGRLGTSNRRKGEKRSTGRRRAPFAHSFLFSIPSDA